MPCTNDDVEVWSTSTRGEGSDVYCIIQDGGNLVLYNDGDRPIWASHIQKGTFHIPNDDDEYCNSPLLRGSWS
ncbi:hypothetical protein F9C07_11903 [Aspergillus flavus]|uniref:Bulb-type lectin domain-containing protein n=1 Tax=Aspergillus flavus (strain ATCC 200026 / FGSC A1120 / IAM 13836 / NRRL 3357 / JCM 12722 / SRRC 167) TaxID=332952 RepID=A0A7U2N3J3_ASPFN|nr:hypothetical protein F9C07_11903 [Aspergillus flavus]